MGMEYVFQWDPNKARSNQSKHDISFRQASQVFKDPAMMTVFDDEHSFDEDRWITVGLVGRGLYLLVVHTFDEINPEKSNVRIISARRATRSEIDQYQGG